MGASTEGNLLDRTRRKPVTFFFQAEDGIRDLYVTGVQTCALPIYLRFDRSPAWANRRWCGRTCTRRTMHRLLVRSEERRVGKECRCRGWGCHDDKSGVGMARSVICL